MVQRDMSHALSGINHIAIHTLLSFSYIAVGYPRLCPDLLHKRHKHKLTSLQHHNQSCRSTAAATAPSHFRITSLPCICATQPLPLPPFFFATCSIANPKSNEQSWEIPQTQLSVQLLSIALTVLNMCIASPIGFFDLFCGLLSLSILRHTASQAQIICSGIDCCGSGARPEEQCSSCYTAVKADNKTPSGKLKERWAPFPLFSLQAQTLNLKDSPYIFA